MEYAARLTRLPSRRTMGRPGRCSRRRGWCRDRRLRPHRQRRRRVERGEGDVVGDVGPGTRPTSPARTRPRPRPRSRPQISAEIPGKDESTIAAAILPQSSGTELRGSKASVTSPLASQLSDAATERRTDPHGLASSLRTPDSPKRGAKPSGGHNRRSATQRGACAFQMRCSQSSEARSKLRDLAPDPAGGGLMTLPDPSGPAGGRRAGSAAGDRRCRRPRSRPRRRSRSRCRRRAWRFGRRSRARPIGWLSSECTRMLQLALGERALDAPDLDGRLHHRLQQARAVGGVAELLEEDLTHATREQVRDQAGGELDVADDQLGALREPGHVADEVAHEPERPRALLRRRGRCPRRPGAHVDSRASPRPRCARLLMNAWMVTLSPRPPAGSKRPMTFA